MDERVKKYIQEFFENYPEAQVQDLYKALYQAYHGAEHAITDEDSVRTYLLRELEEIKANQPDDEFELIESIYISGLTPQVYRVNLVPAAGMEIDPERILQEFLRTGREFPEYYEDNSRSLHVQFKNTFISMVDSFSDLNIKMSGFLFRQTMLEMEKQNWPAIHHSTRYIKTYNPHYRLIMEPDNIVGL